MEKKSREKNMQHLAEGISLSASIKCSRCNHEESIEFVSDEEDAADSFYDYGWRADDEEVLCKGCYKKSR